MQKQQKISGGFLSMFFSIGFDIFYDKHTLDHPVVAGVAGMKMIIWRIDGRDGYIATWHCYGIHLNVQFWFLHFMVMLTPVIIKQKQPS